MKKIVPLFLLVLTPAFAAYAKEASATGPLQQHCKEKKCEVFQSACQAPETSAYNAPVNLAIQRVCKDCNFSTDLNFVYYQAMQDNLEYISSSYSVDNSIGSGETHTRKHGQVDFDYKPGFKLGFNAEFGCDQWNVSADYFWFHAQPSKNRFSETIEAQAGADYQADLYWSATDDGHDADELSPSTGEGMTVSASSNWRVNMDWIDLSLGRHYYVGQKITLRPTLGLRGGWLDQSYNVAYTGENTSTNTKYIHASTNNTNSSGIGFRAGCNTVWNCYSGLFLFGNMHGSLLYTRYSKIRTYQTMTEVNTSTNIPARTDIHSTPDRHMIGLRPQADMSIGFGWASNLYNKVHLDLRAGWDMQVFWNQNMFQKFFDNSQDPNLFKGDLYLQGLVISSKLSF